MNTGPLEEKAAIPVSMDRNTQRWRVICFSTLTVGLELLWMWGWVSSVRRGFHPPLSLMSLGMMYVPGLVSVLCRVVFTEGFGDVGWRVGKARYWAWAYLLPLGIAALAYATALVGDMVAPAPSNALRSPMSAGLYSITLPFQDTGVAGLVFQRFVLVALAAIPAGFIYAFGEELGWRGYLLARILRTGWPCPLLIAGLIWGLFHYPFILLTNYGYHGPFTLLGYTALTVLFGVFASWLWLKSGSVWVATMAHASFNAFVQGVGMQCFTGEDDWFWVGDYGILILGFYAPVVAWLYLSGQVRAAVECHPAV